MHAVCTPIADPFFNCCVSRTDKLRCTRQPCEATSTLALRSSSTARDSTNRTRSEVSGTLEIKDQGCTRPPSTNPNILPPKQTYNQLTRQSSLRKTPLELARDFEHFRCAAEMTKRCAHSDATRVECEHSTPSFYFDSSNPT